MIVSLALVAAGCGDDAESATPDSDVDLGALDAAVFTLDGEASDLGDFVGTPLVVNFFAESCPPCVAEMPMFDGVAREMAGKVTFVGVSEDATHAAAERIVAETGVTYPIVWDRDGSVLAALETLGLPTTLFVDASGEVLESHTGAFSEDALRERLAKHF